MDGPLEDLQTPVEDKRIAKAMKAGGHEDVILEEDDSEYQQGDTFLSFTVRLKDQYPGRLCQLAIYQPG